jgi:hypothetical protein
MADTTLPAGAPQAVTISLARFDWLWPLVNGGNEAIHGVKIDVQGMEIETLRGMRDMLRRHRPRLVVELHAGVERDGIFAALDEIGYSHTATPIDAAAPAPHLLDDRSYAFEPA